MLDVLKELVGAPAPNLLIVAGLLFLALAVVGKISGKVEPGTGGRIAAGILGVALTGLGLYLHTQRHLPPETPPTTTPVTAPATTVPPTTVAPVVTSTPEPAPRSAIISFIATPTRVEPGAPARLRWQTTHADEVTLDGAPVPLTGEQEVRPESTRTFELVARSRAHTDVRAATVEVRAPPPRVLAFDARPVAVRRGESSVLRWETRGGASVTLDSRPVSPSGETRVVPSRTTTYVLTAIGPDGSEARHKLQVVVTTGPPRILSFEAKPRSVRRGEGFELAWDTADAQEVTLGGKLVEAQGKVQLRAETSREYVLVATSSEGETERRLKVAVTAERDPGAQGRQKGTPSTFAVARLGLFFERPPDESSKKAYKGAYVRVVKASFPAEKAGLRPGDMIVAVNGVSVKDPESFAEEVERAGREMTAASLRVMRDGKTFDTKISLR